MTLLLLEHFIQSFFCNFKYATNEANYDGNSYQTDNNVCLLVIFRVLSERMLYTFDLRGNEAADYRLRQYSYHCSQYVWFEADFGGGQYIVSTSIGDESRQANQCRQL